MIFQIAIVVGLFLAVTGGLEYVQHLIATKEKQEVAIQQCVANTTSLEGTVAEQNRGADAVKKAADDAVAKAKAEAAAAKLEAEKHRKSADALAAAQPSDPQNACKSWNDLVNGYLKKRQGKS